ncbi:MAG: hypothetical protein ACYTGQ_19795 [Planctomycetota bacterium]
MVNGVYHSHTPTPTIRALHHDAHPLPRFHPHDHARAHTGGHRSRHRTPAETDRQQLAADKQRLTAAAEKIAAESNALFITTDYDAASDTTTLSSRSWDMDMTRGAARYHWLSVEASFKGKTPPANPPAATINFQTFFTGGVYGKLKDVTLTADGQALRLPITGYENRYRRGGTLRNKVRKDDEFFSVSIKPEQLRAIAGASGVTGEMGNSKFTLTHDQIASFKTLARQLNVIR